MTLEDHFDHASGPIPDPDFCRGRHQQPRTANDDHRLT